VHDGGLEMLHRARVLKAVSGRRPSPGHQADGEGRLLFQKPGGLRAMPGSIPSSLPSFRRRHDGNRWKQASHPGVCWCRNRPPSRGASRAGRKALLQRPSSEARPTEFGHRNLVAPLALLPGNGG
jgi:hypothetical protein